jgi:hypothetical protein
MDADRLVASLLEGDDNIDPKAFIQAHGQQLDGPSRKHLFVGHDGDLYDTRKPEWHKGQPIRKQYQYFHTDIQNLANFKSTWRARHNSNYPLAFLTDDGAYLCEKCVQDNLARIMSSIRGNDRDGWRVMGVGQCHGDTDEPQEYHSQCAHCNKNLGEVA